MAKLSIQIKIKDSAAAKIAFSTGPFSPSTAVLQAVGERAKTRIIERTTKGQDFEGKPFAPYSTNGPYYFYPNAHSAPKSRARSVSRYSKQLGGKPTASKKGIRFKSYADFKASLGRHNVDLTGPKAPHMLQSIVVRVHGKQIILGIYDDKKAKIAEGHNTGTKTLPQRRFLDLSPAEQRLIKRDIILEMFKAL